MVGRADGLAGPVVLRAHVVEEQERIDHLEPAGGKRPPNDEPAAFDGPRRKNDLRYGAMLRHTGYKAGRAAPIPPEPSR
jgi:hypothetical protein